MLAATCSVLPTCFYRQLDASWLCVLRSCRDHAFVFFAPNYPPTLHKESRGVAKRIVIGNKWLPNVAALCMDPVGGRGGGFMWLSFMFIRAPQN